MNAPEPTRPPSGPLERRAKQARSVGFYTMIPTTMVVGPVAGLLLGNWLEGRFGHAPWFTLGCLVLGGVASVRQVVLILNRGNAAAERDKRSRS